MNIFQEQFCEEYLKDHNGAKAAERAGYSKKTARQQAARMLSIPEIQTRIKELETEKPKIASTRECRELLTEIARNSKNSAERFRAISMLTRLEAEENPRGF